MDEPCIRVTFGCITVCILDETAGWLVVEPERSLTAGELARQDGAGALLRQGLAAPLADLFAGPEADWDRALQWAARAGMYLVDPDQPQHVAPDGRELYWLVGPHLVILETTLP